MADTKKVTDEIKRNNIFYVPLTKLKILEKGDPNDYNNDRQDYGTFEQMNELAESIYHNGVRTPIKGYKDGDMYVVIQGHRRFKAGQMIKQKYGKTIIYPLVTYPIGSTKKDFLLDTLLTNSGKDLTPLETASVVSKLISDEKIKMKPKEIATLLGVSEVYVFNLNRLWGVSDKTKKLIRENVVSAATIMGVLKNKNTNLDEFIAEVEKQAAADGSGKKAGKGSKKKQATVTAKNAPGGSASIKDLKKFIKQAPEEGYTFKNKARQETYEFVSQVLKNKVSYTDILEYFTGK